ncbi:MAG: hypothetical protein KAI66_15975, partial [Lentisphaeria bacterium]|nr:hypothetical protein [Lentisphaeria bacterium]
MVLVLLVLGVCLARAGVGTARSVDFLLSTIGPEMGPPRLDASVTARSEVFTLDTGAEIVGAGLVRSGLFTVDTRDVFGVRITSPYSSVNRRAVFLDGVSCDVTFTVNVDWNGHTPGSLRFITPWGSHTQLASTPSRTFDVGFDFGVGGWLKVVAVDAAGYETDPFDANIVVAPVPPGVWSGMLTAKASGNSLSYHLINVGSLGMSVYNDKAPTVPDDIPLFGGKGYGFDKLNLNLEVDIASAGTAEYSGSGDTGSKLKFGGHALDTSLGAGVGWVYDAVSETWNLDEGFVLAGVSAGTELGPYYTVVMAGPVPIPVYLRGEVGGSLDAHLGIAGFSNDDWRFTGTLEPSVHGEVVAGVGIAHGLAAEVYLGIGGGVELGFPDTPTLRDAYITQSGGIRAVALIKAWEKPLWEFKWSLHGGRSGSIIELPDFRDGPGQLLPRTYVSMRGTEDGSRVRSPSRTAVPGGTETVLATNVFPYAQPVLGLHGDKLVLLWVGDDGTRSDTNRTKLFSRTWTSAAGWSADTVVEDDGTADFAPAQGTTTAGVVAVWENFNAVLPDDADFETMLAAEEISVSDYDAAGGTWSPAQRLTDNAVVDHVPCVAATGGAALAVWVCNDSNDLLGTPDMPNTLVYSHRLAGGDWSAPAEFATGVAGVVKADLAFDGTQGIYVFVVDADGDLSTDTDQELYRAEFAVGAGWQAPVRLTDDDVVDTNPQLLTDANDELCLFWYRAGGIMLARAADLSDQVSVVTTDGGSGSSDFRACISSFGQIALVYASASLEGQDLYSAVYDTERDSWGAPQQLTEDPAMERSVTAAYTTDGILVAIYNKIPMVMETRTVAVGAKSVEVEVPVPDMANVSLCSLTRTIAGDLTVNDVRFTPENPAPGAQVTIFTTVGNIGDLAATDVVVAFYNGDPNARAEQIGETVISGVLASGAVADVSVNWTVPTDAVEGLTIFVVVDPDNVYNERDTANNTATAGVLQPDIVLDSLYLETVGPDSYVATVRIVNEGTIPAENIVIGLYENDGAGALLAQDVVSLAPAASVVRSFAVVPSARAAGDFIVFSAADPGDLIVEVLETNNSRS